jgi:4-carboxymuconolactone decarboxylase
MTHIAIVEQLDGKSTEWMEQVSDAQYNAPVRAQESSVAPARSAAGSGQQTPAQRLIGDFAPKLVELADNVLFGDVRARPELSQRDRSLVTVSALIALNRPDQLRSHLAFYAGWASAMTAISVAKEVFQKN